MASLSDVSCSKFFASDILVDIEVTRNTTKTAISTVNLAFSDFMDAVIKPEAMADDSDEEDLEALRLAALQSIKSKPTVVALRRRPKPTGRPIRPRNFYRGCVNTNLISIVPMDNPLENSEPLTVKVTNEPPPLVLPQDRYCKTEVKSEPAEKEAQVSTKFSRFEDSNSADSDDDLDDDYDEKSSDSDHPCETTEKTVKTDADDLDADDDELLLADEDSLGKFFSEMEEELEEKDQVKSPSAKLTSQSSVHKRPSEKVRVPVKDSPDHKDKDMTRDRPSVKQSTYNKTSILGKRVHENSESVNSKEDSSCKNYLHDCSPIKKALTSSEEDGRRINRPCIVGRNRSPSPVRSKQDHFESSPGHSRKRNDSPLKRKPSPPSPGSLSPFYKRETQLMRLSQGKTAHPPRSLPSRNSPQDITPPSYWGSRSNSNHGYSHPLTSREWSSSPHKWSGHPVPGSLSDPPRHSSSKNISSPQQRRASKSPPQRVSRVRRSSDRDWSASPPHRRYRDFDTPPDSLRSINDGNEASRRKSSSPVRLGERSRPAEIPFPRRFAQAKKSSRSPMKMRRSRSPIRSLSRTPSLSPSPDREGKSSTGNYRRHKSPLRLPGYRPPGLRDGRPFRQDGKASRKDGDRQRAMRLNGPTRKTNDSKLEVSKMRSLSTKIESKSSEVTVEEKVDSSAKNVVRAKSPNNVPPPSSWSSDEGGESDSESRFKGTDSKGPLLAVTPPKPVPSTLSKVRESEEPTPPGKKSPKKKKSKRTKKAFSKSKGKDNSPDEPKAKRMNDVDLRAELSRRRAERVSKAKSTNPSVPVRLVQSAFQSLTSKSNSIDGERSTLKSFATKNDAGTELLISKKKPIHMRLGLPVARNPDPHELPVLAGSLLPRISGLEKADGGDPSGDGGNKWRKVKLKRSVTVQKSQSRGTPTNASGKEQV